MEYKIKDLPKLKQYNSYHTIIKQLAKRNKLPRRYISCIDRSTIWRWKNEEDNKYIGNELSNIDLLERFLDRKESVKIIRSYIGLVSVISKILTEGGQLHKILRRNKDVFIRSFLKFRNNIDFKLVLRLCDISISVFYTWKHQVLYNCLTSPVRLCKRIYPNQLSRSEITRMKEMLSDKQFQYWPVCSIAYYALRNKFLSISLSTWYRYIQKLGLERPRPPRKSNYGPGIRASHPHRVWHADITVVKCLNGMKYYVYLLMDNFSRFILNFRVSEKVSGKIRLGTIKQAYEDYIKIPGRDVRLIVDGGMENNNKAVDDYIGSDEVSVRKLIAGKDIEFSNSIVEAQNKIIKYQYLFRHDFKDIHELRNLLNWIISDYNMKRPHCSLEGLTPYETLTGVKLPKEQWQNQILDAKRERLKQNAKERCALC